MEWWPFPEESLWFDLGKQAGSTSPLEYGGGVELGVGAVAALHNGSWVFLSLPLSLPPCLPSSSSLPPLTEFLVSLMRSYSC